MKRIKLIELIKEIVQEVADDNILYTTIGELEFDKNIFKGDNLPNMDDTMRKVNWEGDLEDWKYEKDPSAEVIINRNPKTTWFDVIKVPSFEKAIEKYKQGKQATLDKEREMGYKYLD